ncbi:MAG: cryptochrome/photolyase family protein, partial [Pseudomonadota bacterium]
MTTALLVFPNQLFADHPGLQDRPDRVVLVEDPLFFGDPTYPATFHKQKLWLHRASMAQYSARLASAGHAVTPIAYQRDVRLIDTTLATLAADGATHIFAADPVDFTAERRLRRAADAAEVSLTLLPTPLFLNETADNQFWAQGRKRWFMAEFYKYQRRRLDVLMEGDAPAGGQWSFDEDNRKKVPKAMLAQIPEIPILTHDALDFDARDSVSRDFPDAYGTLTTLYYPTTHDQAADWLDRFLHDRFHLFGDYEDAIVEGE